MSLGALQVLWSLEDFVEEIVGYHIQDEYDTLDLVEKELEQGVYLLSAQHEIAYLNEEYGWDIPVGYYDIL